MRTIKWLGRVALAAVICMSAGAAAAQDDEAETRPAGTTFLGDTGLWFVPTAEIVGHGSVAGAGHVATFNREQGFSAIQLMAGAFAVGIRDRVEVFGSVGFLTRIDRDVRPLFVPAMPDVGGVVTEFPLARNQFSGNHFGDVVVGAKVNLLSERTQAPVAVAARSWIKFPTGDEMTGTTTGELDGGIGLVVSKAVGIVELAAYGDFVMRSDIATITVPNSLKWGVGIGAPLRGPFRFFVEMLGDAPTDDTITLTEPLIGADGSLSGLTSSQRSLIDVVLGAQWQGPAGISIGGGLSWAPTHAGRSTVNQMAPTADKVSFVFRLNYHPGVKVYVPPPPPPPPPPVEEPNRPPTVTATCDPCVVEFGEEVALRADAADPDGDPLTYRWTAPNGTFLDDADGATTRWRAPDQEGPVPATVTVNDGRGGEASDTVTIQVNPPPPPARIDYVFEDVHFDFDRYSLRPGATRVLDEVVAAMSADPELTIEIEGHTCNIGTNEYNLALGDRRANSVQEYLTSRGVGAGRLRTVSYGEERSAHDNSREETRRLNRRAALVVRVQ